jgi:hypothetical protein
MKKLLLILFLNISLLFSPPPIVGSTIAYGRYVSLGKYAGFFVNPDAYGFILPAINPKKLMEYHEERQNRPLFVLAGTALGYSISLLAAPFHKLILHIYKKFWRGAYSESMIFYIGNFYIGFVLLNILILWVALFLFEKIYFLFVDHNGTHALPMFLLMVFIVSNPVTKAFFWTVHEQMFAFLTPILCIYILFRFNNLSFAVSYSRLAGIFIMGGILLLVYGNFILLAPALLYGVFIQSRKFDDFRNWPVLVWRCCFLTLVFFLPTICWIGILKWNGIIYYNFEMHVFHHIVWIPETLHQSFGRFVLQLSSNTIAFLNTMFLIMVLVVFSFIIFIAGKIKVSLKDEYVRMIIFIFLYFFLFYWLLGAYFERLTLTLIPIIICFWLVAAGKKLFAKKMIYVLSSLAFIWQLYFLMSYGPFY